MTWNILIPERGLCFGGGLESVVPADSNRERVRTKIELTDLGVRCGDGVSFSWVAALYTSSDCVHGTEWRFGGS